MRAAPNVRGPILHRIALALLAAALFAVSYWFVDFAVDDLGSLPGPNAEAFERGRLDAALPAAVKDLDRRIEEADRRIQSQRERQDLLRRGTENAQQTMAQLLAVQKLGLEKGVRPTEAEQSALAESERQFLDSQRRFQEINEDLARVTEERRALELQRTEARERLERAREPIQAEFRGVERRHDLRIAALKLAFLVPLLAAALWLLVRRRTGGYAVIAYAAGTAVLVKTAEVVHAYFPSRLFKYVLLGAVAVAVVKLMVHLVRMRIAPRPDWLLARYREAYGRFECPSCEYPIRRGPHRWRVAGVKGAAAPPAPAAPGDEDAPYTCPACGERLYAPCPACGEVRPALLPYCDRCGAPAEARVAAAGG
jgi:hypothetical protein